MKRVIAILCALLVVGLSACSQNKQESTSSVASVEPASSGSEPSSITEESTVSDVLNEEEVVFHGTVVEMVQQDAEKSILLASLETKEETLFHIDEKTKLNVNLDELQPGDLVTVYFSGITTRSIPPQATAFEIDQYAEQSQSEAQ